MPCAPRQHHYVTASYLEGFLDAGQTQLFCYGRQNPQGFRTTPDKLARIRDYYSYRRADGTLNDKLERLIGSKVEDPGISIIRDLCTGKTRLNWERRKLLSFLIGLQRTRVPYEREFMDAHHKDSIATMLTELESHPSKGVRPDPSLELAITPFNTPPNELQWTRITKSELVLEQQLANEDPEAFSRESCVELAATFAEVFAHMKWTLCFAAGAECFVTSDCPVVVTFQNKTLPSAGLMRIDCEVRFPLSKSALLKLRHDVKFMKQLDKLGSSARAERLYNRLPEISVQRLQDHYVRELNEQHAEQAYRWIFTGSAQDWVSVVMSTRQRNIRQVFVKHRKAYSIHSVQPD